MESAADAHPAPSDSAARLRIAACLATLAMLAMSGPLWVEGPDFPRVPFVAGLPTLPELPSRIAFAVLMLALATAAVGIAWRPAIASGLVLMAALVLQDQHRLQPWVYQFLLIGLALVSLPGSGALGCSRLLLIALYFHSGLSKLDVSFCREMGDLFLKTAAGWFGLDPSRWPSALRLGATLAMPAWELAVAVGLIFRPTRRAAMLGAIAMHVALIAILGPWGLRHSAIVLAWNATLIVEVLILFGPGSADPPAEKVVGSWMAGWTRWAFAMAALLPFGERWGLWDTWPSFALYASHGERVEVFADREGRSNWPDAARAASTPAGEGWYRLDLTAWSRSVRGVPVYPQGRACLGLAEALAGRTAGGRSTLVVVWGRADRWTGHRERREGAGIGAIRRLGDRSFLNAHPAPGKAGGRADRHG